MIDITPVLLILIGLVLAWITPQIVALSGLPELVKRKTPSEWQWLIDDLVSTGTKAAEQVYRNESGAGAAKMRYALNFITGQLARYNLKIDEAALRSYIEAEVGELKKYQALSETRVPVAE